MQNRIEWDKIECRKDGNALTVSLVLLRDSSVRLPTLYKNLPFHNVCVKCYNSPVKHNKNNRLILLVESFKPRWKFVILFTHILIYNTGCVILWPYYVVLIHILCIEKRKSIMVTEYTILSMFWTKKSCFLFWVLWRRSLFILSKFPNLWALEYAGHEHWSLLTYIHIDTLYTGGFLASLDLNLSRLLYLMFSSDDTQLW